jgi:hypothetical protein
VGAASTIQLQINVQESLGQLGRVKPFEKIAYMQGFCPVIVVFAAGACGVVVGAPVVEATRPGSIPIGISRVRHTRFSSDLFPRVLDIRVMPQWDYGVPVVYEVRATSVISRRTRDVYEL